MHEGGNGAPRIHGRIVNSRGLPRTMVKVLAVASALALLAGCSSSTVSMTDGRLAAPGDAVSSGFPGSTFDVLDNILTSSDLYNGLLSCGSAAGCFGDDGQTQILQRLDEISRQLEETKAEINAGLASTRVDVSTGDYAAAERAYSSKFGNYIAQASASLNVMTDPSASADDREYELENFKRDAAILMPGSAQTALTGFFKEIAGSGEELSQGGLLGSAWRLILAKERERQGDAKGQIPAYLPASSVNLMAHMGEQRVIEGSQLVTIIAAYSVILNPTLYAKPNQQRRLSSDLSAIWRDGGKSTAAGGKPVQPGAAAVVAALPRPLPSYSGVFTAGLGVDRNTGLLVRNFGPVANVAMTTGPIVSADSGYALAPGLDNWLATTLNSGSPRRELALSRSSVNWTFDPASGSLTTTVGAVALPQLQSEAGVLTVVVGPSPTAGSVIGFARAGTATPAAWTLDAATGRISLASDPSLCMAVGGRADRFSAFGNNWVRGLDALGWLYPDGTYPEWATHGMLPRVSLQACQPDTPTQQWFFTGPVPADGLPWADPQALAALDPQAAGMADYPAAQWKPLTTEHVEAVFAFLGSRGIKDRALFDLYGAATTPAESRALPPVLHPVVTTFGNRLLDAQAKEWPKYENRTFDLSAIVFPTPDASGKPRFTVRPTSKPFDDGTDVTSFPWVSTAAILGQQVEPCEFLYSTPQNTSQCSYKAQLLKAYLDTRTKVADDSPVMLAPVPERPAPESPAPEPSATAPSSQPVETSPAPEPSVVSSPEASASVPPVGPSEAASTSAEASPSP